MPDHTPTPEMLARAREIAEEWIAEIGRAIVGQNHQRRDAAVAWLQDKFGAWDRQASALAAPIALALDALAADRDRIIAAMRAALLGVALTTEPLAAWCDDGCLCEHTECIAGRDALALTPATLRERAEKEREFIDAASALVVMCRNYFDGQDLRIDHGEIREDWPSVKDVLGRAGRALAALDHERG